MIEISKHENSLPITIIELEHPGPPYLHHCPRSRFEPLIRTTSLYIGVWLNHRPMRLGAMRQRLTFGDPVTSRRRRSSSDIHCGVCRHTRVCVPTIRVERISLAYGHA